MSSPHEIARSDHRGQKRSSVAFAVNPGGVHFAETPGEQNRHRCSDDFLFDNQVLVQAVHWGFRLGEISCPTHYFPEASSMGPLRSVVYGLGVLETAARYRLHHLGLVNCGLIAPDSAPCPQAYESLLS